MGHFQTINISLKEITCCHYIKLKDLSCQEKSEDSVKNYQSCKWEF